jgi:hypothetical protein
MRLELRAIIIIIFFSFLRADIQILRNLYRLSRKKVHFRGKEALRLYSSGLIDGGGDIPI